MPQKGQIITKQSCSDVSAGDILTISGEIIDVSGMIIHKKGDLVEVESLNVIEGFWSTLCPDIWIPEKINSIKLVGVYGHWFTSSFVETQHLVR